MSDRYADRLHRSPDAELSAASQDYLKEIWTAQEWSGESPGTKRLAERIGVSPSTVSEAVKKLADQGYVDHVRYGAISLTPKGEAVALTMVRRHRLVETFLVTMLGYGWDEVHDEAEVLEHAVSDVFVSRLDAALGHPTRDPHGDPIPAEDGQLPHSAAVRLWGLPEGDSGVVDRICDDDPALLRWFEETGIDLDRRLTVVGRQDFMGVLMVSIDGGEPVAVGEPAATAVWVVAD